MKKFYFLLIVAFVGFIGNAQISYPSPICINSTNAVLPVFAPGSNTGGTFTSSPSGLLINPVNGQINPSGSVAGTYLVTYTVPAGPPDFITYTTTSVVIISPLVVPMFTQVLPICSGSTVPLLPATSTNGIVGTWSPSTISSSASGVYTFTPNPDQCADPVTMVIPVFSPYVPVIESASGLNTVYVDGSNQVVVPLELLSDTPDGYDMQWSEGSSFIGGANDVNYTVNTESPTGSDRVYRIFVTHATYGCDTYSSEFVVHQSSGVPPPMADRFQNLAPGSTLADIIVSGNGIRWYGSPNGKNNNIITSTPLPLSTVLIDNTTYYASQTVSSNESVERLPVTVHLVLGIGGNELESVSYFPNPVKNSLTIKALNTIDNISVINVLGQVLKTTNHNEAEVIENIDEFSAGTYFIRVSSGDRAKVLKVIKY